MLEEVCMSSQNVQLYEGLKSCGLNGKCIRKTIEGNLFPSGHIGFLEFDLEMCTGT